MFYVIFVGSYSMSPGPVFSRKMKCLHLNLLVVVSDVFVFFSCSFFLLLFLVVPCLSFFVCVFSH